MIPSDSTRPAHMQSERKALARLLPLLVFACTTSAFAAHAQRSVAPYRQTLLNIQQSIQANDLQSARSSIAAALQRYPSDGGLENLLGIVEIEQGHVEPARAAFSQAIEHSPHLVSAYLNLARIDLQTAGDSQNREREALQLYQRVVAIEPANAEANYQEAILFLARHMYRQSLQSAARLDAQTRQKAQVQALLCSDETALGHTGEADRAAASMAAGTDLTEQDVMTALPFLKAAHRADLIDTLLTACDTRQPLSIAGLRYLGLAQEAESKPQQAQATLERAFAMDPTSAAPLVDLAHIAVADGEEKAALGYLAHAEALRPQDASLPYEFGVACLRMNLIAAARKSFGEAVTLDPNNPEYNLVLGTLLSSPGGLPYLTKYIALRPADPEGMLALGVAYFQDDDFGNASVWLTKAAGSTGTAASALYYLGRILLQEGKYDRALGQLLKSEALQPDQPDVLAQLGNTYMQMGNYRQAQIELAHAIALDGDNYTANFALVRLYAHTNDPRRQQQAARFQDIRNKGEEQYRSAMRIIEARPAAGESTPR